MKHLLLTCVVLAASVCSLKAATLTVSPVNGNLYQQTVQSPCVFSNPSCQNGAFPTVNLPTGGSVSGYDALSVIYMGSQILALLNGSALNLGMDINQASGQPAQTLTMLTMTVTSAANVLLSTDTFSFAGTGNVPAGNNGNGYADYLISGFSSFGPTDKVQFHFVFNDANDGTENLFVIGTAGSIPEPATYAFVALGLAGLGLLRRRR
jgi:hypothetical protein